MASEARASAPIQLPPATFSGDLIAQTLATLPSAHSRRSYKAGILALLTFAGSRPVSRQLIYRWRESMAKRLKPTSVNRRLNAARKLFEEASRQGVLTRAQAFELSDVDRLKELGRPAGNWLTREQCRALLGVPDRKTVKGKRAYCILSILLGCGLRRAELSGLMVEQLQMREGRWVLADLQGKGGRIRTVAVPAWVKEAIDSWMKAAKICSGKLVRTLSSAPQGLGPFAIWKIVNRAAESIGVPNFGPHDLRRTCAKLCRSRGARLEQIQEMLGHSSVATTELYLGTIQDLRHAPNDDLGIWS